MPFPVEEKYIVIAEKELRATFPPSFRDKMMKSNGGGVEISSGYFELHPIYDSSEKKRIKRTCNSIIHETKNARLHYGIPGNLIVIGSNGGGDVLVYKIEKDGSINSTVYWFNHETEELVVAANDFSELFESV